MAYIIHATDDFYVYDFLDPSGGKGRIVGYVFGILAGIAVLFGVVSWLIWLRSLLARRLGKDRDGSSIRQRSVTKTKEEGNEIELNRGVK